MAAKEVEVGVAEVRAARQGGVATLAAEAAQAKAAEARLGWEAGLGWEVVLAKSAMLAEWRVGAATDDV